MEHRNVWKAAFWGASNRAKPGVKVRRIQAGAKTNWDGESGDVPP